MTIQQLAQKEIRRLLAEKSRLEKLLEDLPEGTLVSGRTRIGAKTYHKWYASVASPETGRRILKYIPRKKLTYARALAHRKVYRKQLSEIENELSALRSYLSKHRDFDVYELLVDDPELMDLLLGKPAIPLTSVSEEAKKWMNEDYETNPHHPEALTVRASNGRMVRSKSEAIIMMLLEKYGIAYRYECRLDIAGGTYYPDFTIRHPITGEIFYWEHFGRMDHPGYRSKCVNKMNRYLAGGLYPDHNLIITYESEGHPLDVRIVLDKINEFFHYSEMNLM